MWEIAVISIGLSMDAFAAAVCKGLSVSKLRCRHLISAGLWFGSFQALMPVIGYLLGTRFCQYIEIFDHWLAFFLLTAIGICMILETEKEEKGSSFSPTEMFPLAVSTSIDALIVGVTLAIARINITTAATVVGFMTFTLSALGVLLGNILGSKSSNGAKKLGGAILIFIGVKILFEHLEICV